jgi:hypothetical protein
MISPPKDLNKIKNLVWALPLIAALTWWGFTAFLNLPKLISLGVISLAATISLVIAFFVTLAPKYDASYCLLISGYLFTFFLAPLSGFFIDAIFGKVYALEIFLAILACYAIGIGVTVHWHWRRMNDIPTSMVKKFAGPIYS